MNRLFTNSTSFRNV